MNAVTAIVCASIVILLGLAGAQFAVKGIFDPLNLSISITLLLLCALGYRLAGRAPKAKPKRK